MIIILLIFLCIIPLYVFLLCSFCIYFPCLFFKLYFLGGWWCWWGLMCIWMIFFPLPLRLDIQLTLTHYLTWATLRMMRCFVILVHPVNLWRWKRGTNEQQMLQQGKIHRRAALGQKEMDCI